MGTLADSGEVRASAALNAAAAAPFFKTPIPAHDKPDLHPLPFGFDASGVPGPVEFVAERLRADDFAFDCDGNAYLATHIQNSLLRLTSGGARVNVAGVADGMAGSTAVTFGAIAGTASSAFVTTTGGVVSPVDGIVAPAKLIRVDIGTTGLPITDAQSER